MKVKDTRQGACSRFYWQSIYILQRSFIAISLIWNAVHCQLTFACRKSTIGTHFTPLSSVSIVDFGKILAGLTLSALEITFHVLTIMLMKFQKFQMFKVNAGNI